MKKISKHLSILKKRLKQQNEINRLTQIENTVLKQFLTAFNSAKSSSKKTSDLISFSNCEHFRRALLTNNTQINYAVFSLTKTDTVKAICAKASSGMKWGQFLYYLAKSFQKPNILEIGTNLGVSGSFLLEGLKNTNGKLTTMEGLPQLCEIAENQFSTIVDEQQYEVIQGLYEDTLPKVINKNDSYNLAFIDGNHQKSPTIEYFNAIKSRIEDKAIIVFDDINWSEEMKEAWNIIKRHSDVNFSIDLYKQGVIIIDKSETLKNIEFNLHLAY